MLRLFLHNRLLTAALLLAATFTFGCKEENKPDTTFTDERDNKTYRFTKIGEQTWMAENLNYEAEGSKCYGEKGEITVTEYYFPPNHPIDDYEEKNYKELTEEEIQANCEKYGRLYNWETAMKVCPKGWHLPSNAELNKLYHYADSTTDTVNSETPYKSETAGKYLKAASGWDYNKKEDVSGNGIDTYGFAALPGGYSPPDGNFLGVGYLGFWWGASDLDSNYAYSWGFSSYNNMGGVVQRYLKAGLNSVRCVRD